MFFCYDTITSHDTNLNFPGCVIVHINSLSHMTGRKHHHDVNLQSGRGVRVFINTHATKRGEQSITRQTCQGRMQDFGEGGGGGGPI